VCKTFVSPFDVNPAFGFSVHAGEKEERFLFSKGFLIVSDPDSVPVEEAEVRRYAGDSSEEGDHCVRSSDGETGGLLHRHGQQNHRQDAGPGKGKDCELVSVGLFSIGSVVKYSFEPFVRAEYADKLKFHSANVFLSLNHFILCL